MAKNKRIRIIIISILILVIAPIYTIRSQADEIESKQQEIANLEQQIADLTARLNELKGIGNANYEDDSFNYLAIGNSVTGHRECAYWWNEGVGMAASDASKDYVSQLVASLEQAKGQVAYSKFYDSSWELNSLDRAQTLKLLDSYLDPRLNLITIQWGENCVDPTTLDSDYVELITYLRTAAPNAQIIVVGQFLEDEKVENIKKAVCTATGATFVSLEDMWNDSDYLAGMGTIVYGADGQPHEITHNGVSLHPGDKGMKFIADSIMSAVQ